MDTASKTSHSSPDRTSLANLVTNTNVRSVSSSDSSISQAKKL